SDFHLPLDGGWVSLVPPAALATPYDLEVFSGPNGTSFQSVVEARASVRGPPELARKLPAVVVDGGLADLLDDVRARHADWAWWVGPEGLVVGPPGTE